MPITHESRVLDTSCGSGGFLLYALDKVRKEADKKVEDGYFDKDSIPYHNYWHDFAEKNLYGIEISEGIARTAKMNMIIHDDGHTNVISADGLLTDVEIIERTGNKGFAYGGFDFIVTNPPFGSSVKLTEQAYLKNFDLGKREIGWVERKQKNTFELGHRDSQSTEVLFLEQCYRFLTPGGMLAVVLPDGVLTNSSAQYVRDWLEERYRIVAVVSLPQDAFRANDAGVKSSVLFLKKLTEAQTDRIRAAKTKLQDRLWEKPQYSTAIAELEAGKSQMLKQHVGFDPESIDWESPENLKNRDGLILDNNLFGESKKLRKLIEKTEEFKLWRANTSADFTDKINQIKETLQDEYLTDISKELTDYPIFMAIAEQIGYDATGRKTAINELEPIADDLSRFINNIQTGQDSFFV